MISIPLLVLGALLVLSSIAGDRVRERDRGAVGNFVLSPLNPSTWRATLAIVGGFWVLLLAFMIIVGLFSAGASLLVVGVGVVLVALGIEGSRLVARMERARARFADPRPLRPHPYRPYGTGLGELLLAVFGDLNRWRDVLYLVIGLPLVALEFGVVVTLWGGSLALLGTAFWHGQSALGTGGGPGLPSDAGSAVALVVGVLLAPVAASVSQGLMALHRAVVDGLLCESEQQALQRRVEALEGSRRAVLDVEASELRRIERDLHDGAQQRLVALSMDLGRAAERIDTDPEGARRLVLDARDHARLALAELRDLVRGIAPAILLDRGLVPALAAPAARNPVPTSIMSTLPEGQRLPDSVERAAYFVVTEALANVARHASATHCEIRCGLEQGRLVVEIRDDGRGGAMIVPGGGLAGLAGRVEALDGSLAVSSPSGGPTTVRAEIPIAGPAAGTPPPPRTYWTRPS